MSRKRLKNRNMRIGIFKGKSSEYNKRILQVLFYHSEGLTAWQIANMLVPDKSLLKEVLESRSRKIYSVIQRKGARLDELTDFGYITIENGKYFLSGKGSIALFLIKPELLDDSEVINHHAKTLANFKVGFNSEKKFIEGPLGISVNKEKFRKDVEQVLNTMKAKGPDVIKIMVKVVEQLIKQGINLDLVSIETLWGLMSQRKEMQKLFIK